MREFAADVPDDLHTRNRGSLPLIGCFRPVVGRMVRLQEHNCGLGNVFHVCEQALEFGQTGPRAGTARMSEHHQPRPRRVFQKFNVSRPFFRRLQSGAGSRFIARQNAESGRDDDGPAQN